MEQSLTRCCWLKRMLDWVDLAFNGLWSSQLALEIEKMTKAWHECDKIWDLVRFCRKITESSWDLTEISLDLPKLKGKRLKNQLIWVWRRRISIRHVGVDFWRRDSLPTAKVVGLVSVDRFRQRYQIIKKCVMPIIFSQQILNVKLL